jgi:bifunctional non-homologous end joining protein LigD
VLDEHGRSDFGMLQRALGCRSTFHEAGEIICFAFDLLYLNGRDLRRLPRRERRSMLGPILAGKAGAIRLSEEVNATGEPCEHGLEGIIAKQSGEAIPLGPTS